MDTATIEKLRKHTKEISDIMYLAQSSFKIVDYLYRPKDKLALEVINQNQFLKFTREIYWRTYVIELAKLFAERKSEHFNLPHFIQKFKSGGEFHMPESIDETSIRIWEDNLRLEELKIANLKDQRDKLYSHTDRDRYGVTNILSFSDAKELIKIVQRIVSEIEIIVFGRALDFKLLNEPVTDLHKLVTKLAVERQEMIDFYRQHAIDNGIDPDSIEDLST